MTTKTLIGFPDDHSGEKLRVAVIAAQTSYSLQVLTTVLAVFGKNPAVQYALATNPHTPSLILWQVSSRSPHRSVNEAITNHPNVDDELLKVLAESDDPAVGELAAFTLLTRWSDDAAM